MGRILLPIVLGLFAPAMAFWAGAMVEVPGQNPIQEPIAASIAAAVYLAICQFLLTPRESRKLGANWPTMAAMGATLVAVCVVALAPGRGVRELLHIALPPVAAGCFGIVAGAIVAARVTVSALSLASCRRVLRTCVALLIAAVLVIAAGVIPPTRADTFPKASPETVVPGLWVIAGVDVLLAASLAFAAARTRRGRPPSFTALGLLALAAFVLALFLATTAAFFTHGPAMRVAALFGVLCSAANFVVAALVAMTAARLPDKEPA